MKAFLLLITVFVLVANKSMAQQTCQGSLGDAVLNETFGYKHQPLPANKTNYQFSYGCPPPGAYSINDFIFGCDWARTIGDHTPDDSAGCYMLVNGQVNPGVVYMDSLKDLCPNTTYQFQAWVTGLTTKFSCGGYPTSLPNIKFTLKTYDGQTLAVDSTGRLLLVDEVDWKPHGFTIRMPPGITNAIIYVTVASPPGCGVDFALDDITFRPCSPSTIKVDVDGSQGPADVCENYTDPFIMTAQYTPGFADPQLQWQNSVDSGLTWVDIPGETGLVYKMPHRTSGLVLYRICIAEHGNIQLPHCRVTSNVILTRIHPLWPHTALQNLLGCLDKDFHFPPTDGHALEILWTGPNGYNSADPNSVLPAIQYSDTGLYKLKQTFYFHCINTDSFHLNVYPSTTVTIQGAHPICEGSSEQLVASSLDNDTYKWQPATGLSSDIIPNPLARPRDSTVYKIIATNSYGCQDSAYATIDVYRNPLADAGPDKSILAGDTAVLNGVIKGTGVNFYWTPPDNLDDPQSANPHVAAVGEMLYTLHVVSKLGCGSSQDDVVVKVYRDVFIPNAFTPNGDGKNDKFQVIALDNYKLVRLIVYNRWGLLVFETNGSYKAWDGTYNGRPQPPGAYVYNVELLSSAGRRVVKRGTVLLIR